MQAPAATAAAITARLAGVDGDRDIGGRGDALDDRHDSRDLDVLVHRRGAGPRGLPAHVDDGRSLRDHVRGALERGIDARIAVRRRRRNPASRSISP